MSDDDFAARLRRLEDLEAIRVLKYRYCTYCDDGYDAARLAPLFAADAVWDGGALGRFVGREAIRGFFAQCSKLVPFAIHQVTNPVIEVDGDRAVGRWYLWEPIVFASGNRALWMAARYDDRYRRERGEWLFESVMIDLRMLSPYEEGFAKVRVTEIPR
ncbi:MAG: nuclear transport factor 2 family protein [Deltaproteobacteria bacterium]|nr:nuclear transport factor 2 family protein [Deltaproteobacteria bacterium]